MSATIANLKIPTLHSRGSGILLHPTSLPGAHGIGDLGPAAFKWLDLLAAAKQRFWQVLPLGPTGYGNSPYQCFSAFAGNPMLISPDLLVTAGLLSSPQLETLKVTFSPAFSTTKVNYEAAFTYKKQLLELAWQTYREQSPQELTAAFQQFCEEEAAWLDDFALFITLKAAHQQQAWLTFEPSLKNREPLALAKAQKELAEEITYHKFLQFLFFKQWRELKHYANERGIAIIGDLPIFVAADSVDVWSHPEEFLLDAKKNLQVVAGVPPDYFSPTGQRWGNPLYNWQVMENRGFSWWLKRLQTTLKTADILRIDHFRGFAAYWEIPGHEPTAEHGHWVKAPGDALFHTLRTKLGSLPIIAEDLGVITPDVDELRLRHGFPGMRVLQFAFGGAIEDRFLPHNYERETVVYTGTHDNNTTVGWYKNETSPKDKAFIQSYIGHEIQEIHWEIIKLAWASVANIAIAPIQDVLGLDSQDRMNLPGLASDCWTFRCPAELLQQPEIFTRLQQLTTIYGRAAS